jgi:hypothetical protein
MLIKLANSCAPRNIFTKTIHIDGTHDAAPSFEQRVASTPEQLDRVASQEIMRTPGITSMRMRSGSVAGAVISSANQSRSRESTYEFLCQANSKLCSDLLIEINDQVE